MNLYDFVLRGSAQDTAIIDEQDVPWTYGDLQNQAAHLAGYLEQTTSAQDRCLIFADNGLFWICAYLACLRSGRIAVPISPECDDALLQHIVRSCTPRVAFVDTPRRERFRSTAPASILIVCDEDTEGDQGVSWTEASAFLPLENAFAPADDSIATILYTRGSSAEPRGVMLSHQNLAAACKSLAGHLDLAPADRSLCIVPLSGCFGLSSALGQLYAGGGLMLQRLPIETAGAVRRSIQHNCTGITATAATFRLLLDDAGFGASMLPTIRYLQHVGGKAPSGLIAELQQRFPTAAIHAMYGLTEAGGALTAVPAELAVTKSSSAGEPLSRVSIQIVDEYGHSLPAGQIGEIVAESPAIARGYWQDPERSRESFRKGRLYTGDLGTFDPDGQLRIFGRSGDFLRLGGVPVTTSQIEQAIGRFPGLQEQAVLSRHDDIMGESVVLVAVHPRGEEIRQQLLDFCARMLPFNQRPREVHFQSHLPRDAAGRVDLRALQHQIELEHHAVQPFIDRLQAPQEPLQA